MLSVVCIFLFIKTPNDVIKYMCIYVGTTFFGNALLWWNLRKYINKISLKNLDLKKHLKSTVLLFIPQIAIQIYTVLDKTMIGTILNDMTEVGYYEQSQKIVKILLTIITSLGTVMMPRIAKLYAEKDKKQIIEYMYRTFKFVFMLAFPLMLGIVSVSSNFVPLFFGEGYDPVIKLLNVTSPIILFIGFSNVTGSQYLLAVKKQKEFTISVVLGALVNFTLNMILIRTYKSFGAAIATVIAELTVTCVQLIFVRKTFNLFKVLKSSLLYFSSATIMFIVSCVIDWIINDKIYSILIQFFISAIVYFVLLILFKLYVILKIKFMIR